MRYGFTDKLDLRFVDEALKYDLEHLSQPGGKKVHVSNFMPNFNKKDQI
jgi:hypothetical protein